MRSTSSRASTARVGMLLIGGTPITQALGMVSGLLDQALRQNLEAAVRRIREGQSISASLDGEGLTTPVALRMLRVGERTGMMGDMMERTAAFHEEELSRWVERFTRTFEPLLMAAIGIVIGGIVLRGARADRRAGDFTDQGHGGAGHCRTTHSPGRALQGVDQRPRCRFPGRRAARSCPACTARTPCCASSPSRPCPTRRPPAQPGSAGLSTPTHAAAAPPGARTLRHAAGHRPDRQRQDHHALRPAQRDQHGRDKIITIEDPVEYQLPMSCRSRSTKRRA
jgi:hypothetical protein